MDSEKEKPELVRLVNQGLAMDELLEEAEKNIKKLKELKEMKQITESFS